MMITDSIILTTMCRRGALPHRHNRLPFHRDPPPNMDPINGKSPLRDNDHRCLYRPVHHSLMSFLHPACREDEREQSTPSPLHTNPTASASNHYTLPSPRRPPVIDKAVSVILHSSPTTIEALQKAKSIRRNSIASQQDSCLVRRRWKCFPISLN